jgi:hypothetical protein
MGVQLMLQTCAGHVETRRAASLLPLCHVIPRCARNDVARRGCDGAKRECDGAKRENDGAKNKKEIDGGFVARFQPLILFFLSCI